MIRLTDTRIAWSLFGAGFAVMALALWGFPFYGHSYINNILWGENFARILWSGTFYPRWLESLNAGCGEPTFFFYSPLPYAVASLFTPVLSMRAALNAAYALAYGGSLAAFYLWARHIVQPRSAILAAVFYGLAPYLWTDIFHRDAFTEFFSFLFLPLLMLAAERALQGKPRSAVYFALSASGLVLSSVHGTIMGALLCGIYVAHHAVRCQEWRGLLHLAAGGFMALLLCGLYIFPLVQAWPLVKLGGAQGAFAGFNDIKRHFVWSDYVFDQWAFACAAVPFLGATVVLTALHRQRIKRMPYRLLVFFSAVNVALVAIILKPFAFVVDVLPVFRILQFPWRLGVLLAFTAAGMISFVVDQVIRLPLFRLVSAFVLSTFVMLLVIFTRGETTARVHPQLSFLIEQRVAPVPNEYLPLAANQTWFFDNGFKNPTRLCRVQKVTDPAGTAKITIERWASRDLAFRVEAFAPTQLVVGQFAFPGWKAFSQDGQELPLTTTPEGLMSLSLPVGLHSIHVVLTPWRSEKMGAGLTLLGLLIAFLGLCPPLCLAGLRRMFYTGPENR